MRMLIKMKQHDSANGFKKSDRKTVTAAYNGTKANVLSRQILVSTGIKTLDDLLAGGIPIGSLMIIEQDYPSSCYRTLLSKYIIDGLVYDHSVYAALVEHPSQSNKSFLKRDIDLHNHKTFIKSTPENNSIMSSAPRQSTDIIDHIDKSLKISWRYSFLKNTSNETVEAVPSSYQKEFLRVDNVNYFDISYEDTAKKILDFVTQSTVLANKSTSSNGKNSKEIKRLVIEDVSSPLWGSFSHWSPNKLFHYLYALKSALRRSSVSCILTFSSPNINPYKFIPMESFYQKILNISDFYMKLSTISSLNLGSTDSNYYNEYDGFLTFKKLYSLNSVGNYRIPSYEWAFKIKSNRFSIKEIHIPVEDDDDENVVKNASKKKTSMSCSFSSTSSKSNELDF